MLKIQDVGDILMIDPFATLKEALKPILMRNSKDIYREITVLQIALDNFKTNNKKSFLELLKAVRATATCNYIEKWRIDFNTIRAPLDALNQSLDLPEINWDVLLSKPKASPKFQFGALHHQSPDSDLLPWLDEKADPHDTTLIKKLMTVKGEPGFSQKLSAHLETDPEFLFTLIMKSEENFTEIVRTRLVLFLTDRQLAKAIIKHLPRFVQSNQDPLVQSTQLVEKLNENLSNGRSVSTLLRNAEAKLILASSEYLQILTNKASEETEVTPPTSAAEEGGIKPGM